MTLKHTREESLYNAVPEAPWRLCVIKYNILLMFGISRTVSYLDNGFIKAWKRMFSYKVMLEEH